MKMLFRGLTASSIVTIVVETGIPSVTAPNIPEHVIKSFIKWAEPLPITVCYTLHVHMIVLCFCYRPETLIHRRWDGMRVHATSFLGTASVLFMNMSLGVTGKTMHA